MFAEGFQSQTNRPPSTLAFIPPLSCFPDLLPPPGLYAAVILARSSSRLCFASAASLTVSASALAAFSASFRRWFCLCFLVSGSEPVGVWEDERVWEDDGVPPVEGVVRSKELY